MAPADDGWGHPLAVNGELVALSSLSAEGYPAAGDRRLVILSRIVSDCLRFRGVSLWFRYYLNIFMPRAFTKALF